MKTQGQKTETQEFKTKTYLSQTFKKPDHPLKCRSWEGPQKGSGSFLVYPVITCCRESPSALHVSWTCPPPPWLWPGREGVEIRGGTSFSLWGFGLQLQVWRGPAAASGSGGIVWRSHIGAPLQGSRQRLKFIFSTVIRSTAWKGSIFNSDTFSTMYSSVLNNRPGS